MRFSLAISFFVLHATNIIQRAHSLTLSDGIESFSSAVGHYGNQGGSAASNLELDFNATLSFDPFLSGAWSQKASFVGTEEYIDRSTIPYTHYTLSTPFDVQYSVGAADYLRTTYTLQRLTWADFRAATEAQETGVFTGNATSPPGAPNAYRLCDPIPGQPGAYSRRVTLTRGAALYQVYGLAGAAETLVARAQLITAGSTDVLFTSTTEPLNPLQSTQGLPGQPLLTSSLTAQSSGARVFGLSEKSPLTACGGSLYPTYARSPTFPQPSDPNYDLYARATSEFLAWDPAVGGLETAVVLPWLLHRAAEPPGLGPGSLGLTDSDWLACFDCAAPAGACLDLQSRLQSAYASSAAAFKGSCLSSNSTLLSASSTPNAASSSTASTVPPQDVVLSYLQSDPKTSLATRASLQNDTVCTYAPMASQPSPSATATSVPYTVQCGLQDDELQLQMTWTVPASSLSLQPGLFTLNMSDPTVFTANVSVYQWSAAAATVSIRISNPSTYSASIDVDVTACCRGSSYYAGCQLLDASPLFSSVNNQVVNLNETDTDGATLLHTGDTLKADFRVHWNASRLGYDPLDVDNPDAQVGTCVFNLIVDGKDLGYAFQVPLRSPPPPQIASIYRKVVEDLTGAYNPELVPIQSVCFFPTQGLECLRGRWNARTCRCDCDQGWIDPPPSYLAVNATASANQLCSVRYRDVYPSSSNLNQFLQSLRLLPYWMWPLVTTSFVLLVVALALFVWYWRRIRRPRAVPGKGPETDAPTGVKAAPPKNQRSGWFFGIGSGGGQSGPKHSKEGVPVTPAKRRLSFGLKGSGPSRSWGRGAPGGGSATGPVPGRATPKTVPSTPQKATPQGTPKKSNPSTPDRRGPMAPGSAPHSPLPSFSRPPSSPLRSPMATPKKTATGPPPTPKKTPPRSPLAAGKK